jgi:hypothetical protein
MELKELLTGMKRKFEDQEAEMKALFKSNEALRQEVQVQLDKNLAESLKSALSVSSRHSLMHLNDKELKGLLKPKIVRQRRKQRNHQQT